MTLKEMARQAATQAEHEWVNQQTWATDSTLLAHMIADAVAVAVLREVKALADKVEQDAIASYRLVGGDYDEGAMDVAGSLAILIHDRLAECAPVWIALAPLPSTRYPLSILDDLPGGKTAAMLDQLANNRTLAPSAPSPSDVELARSNVIASNGQRTHVDALIAAVRQEKT